jgi:hypothetical protein
VAHDSNTCAGGAVGGTVYVVWMDYARKSLFVDKSTNCGASWNKDVQAATLNVTFTDIGCNGTRSMTPAPYIAVDEKDPQKVYITYADNKGGQASTGMDVYIVYSGDGGQHWSSSFKVNDDKTSTHQYNPALSVASGQLHVSWLDRRRDTAKNCSTETYSTAAAESGFTYYSATKTFSTPSFLSNEPVSSGPSDFDGNPNGPGDYTGNASYVDNTKTPPTFGQPIFPEHTDSTVASFDIYSAQVTP